MEGGREHSYLYDSEHAPSILKHLQPLSGCHTDPQLSPEATVTSQLLPVYGKGCEPSGFGEMAGDGEVFQFCTEDVAIRQSNEDVVLGNGCKLAGKYSNGDS